MRDTAHRAVAIVGLGSILPGAANTQEFWENTKAGRYCIDDVDPARWNPEFYFNPDPAAPDATYSKIGGWVRKWEWDPRGWRLPIPPKVADAMDEAQRWAINCTRSALTDYGYPDRTLDHDRTAIILGNAMAGEKHYMTALRVSFPEFARELSHTDSFASLPQDVRDAIIAQTRDRIRQWIPDITEDSMPGELANCIAGRIANLFNFHGPNYVVDAACASAMAAMTAAVEGLEEGDFDSVITGGIDRNMGASTFVKFCKIGALSANGTCPYSANADGFVMGEGAALFIMKRLADAERDGDHIYAVLRGMGGSSDGKGKGITAPNPVGQKLAIQRGWENAGLSPATATYVEGHGTSTKVGDRVELESLDNVFAAAGAAPGSVGVGSVKSNIGHLKGAAGAAGMLKAVLALHDKVLPPSLNCEQENPNIDFDHSPFYVNKELRDWDKPECGVRRAGVSAFGFGGTNFHAVLEEHIPGNLTVDGGGNGSRYVSVPQNLQSSAPGIGAAQPRAPLGGAAVLGAKNTTELAARLRTLRATAESNRLPPNDAPLDSDLTAPERIAIEFKNPADLSRKTAIALKALERNDPVFWRALGAQGIFRGMGAAQPIAFLYPGQGSQYVNMLKELRAGEPLVREVFEHADRVMAPHLGKPLSEYLFIDENDKDAVKQAARSLMQTEITQPVVLTVDAALTELLGSYGIEPDMVMGHSLGEYGALVASGAMSFADALEAVSARGREMVNVSMEDNGMMAAVFAPIADVQRLLARIDGYLVIANINSNEQAVIGGDSSAVSQALKTFAAENIEAVQLPVSHAFHTKIVAPACEPLRRALTRLGLRSPRIPVISNVTGQFYPQGDDAVPAMLDLLGRQVASPVQFIKGLESLYDAGARVFVEVGPKKALKGFVDSVLGDRPDVTSLFCNHPKVGELTSFNQALCGLYAAGHGHGRAAPAAEIVEATQAVQPQAPAMPAMAMPAAATTSPAATQQTQDMNQLFREFMERGMEIFSGKAAMPAAGSDRIVVSGAALGLPGTAKVFDEDNVGRILHGEQFIDVIPYRFRQAMAKKHITRLVKREDGNPTFESIDDTRDVVKLAGRAGSFDVAGEFGVKPERAEAFDSTTAMAIAVGLDALRDAGIPLLHAYKTTTTGSQLPDRWRLPDSMRDDTGIIFASAFPGMDAFSTDLDEFYTERGHREQLESLDSLREWLVHHGNGASAAIDELDRRIAELKSLIGKTEFQFDRKFLFRILSMGHSQFAEEIGARGPNTQVNAACASTTQAMSMAEDWIRGGRCRRVIVISADNVTSDHLMEWIGAGFLASGAAATDEKVEDAATPFDRRRHGMIAGMGAAAIVVESETAVRERGLQPICEVLGAVTANSAFHGTRLDIEHIAGVMEQLVSGVERRHGIKREQIAAQTMFVSHETYTPARGGSAAAEIHALRRVFGDKADQIVISNTKGFTGHAMGAGVEDVVAIKALETGIVPPVPNFKEVDPELGSLNLSTGGSYPVQYALRLGAGFGSQIAMTLIRWVPSPDGRRRNPDQLGFHYRVVDQAARAKWLSDVSGYARVEEEVSTHRLRIRDQGPPKMMARPSVAEPLTESLAATPVPLPATPQPVVAPEPVQIKPPAPVAQPVAQQPEPVTMKPQAAPPDDLSTQVMAIVADATGYPAEMLEADLDMEADLGIDTVKQAEVFASIRSTFEIPRDDNLVLRDFPTLAHVMQFVRDRAPNLPAAVVATAPVAATPIAESAPAIQTPPAATTDGVEQRVVELVAEKTGYPADMLDLDLDLEADLGVDTVKQAEVFASIRGAYDIARDENLQLREFPTLAHVVQFVRDRAPSLPTVTIAAPAASIAAPAAVAAIADEVPAGMDSVERKVVELVAAKTGYPADMLDLDLDLEADLGVDTVKQAEVFASIRGEYDIPRDENLQLREFPTLAHVAQFVRDRATNLPSAQPAAVPAAVPVAAETAPAAAAATDDGVEQAVIGLVADKTGYPADMLELDLDLEADLGVDTVKQAEVFASIRGEYDIPRDENLQLREFPTLKHVVQFVRDRRPDQPAVEAPVTPVQTSEPATATVAGGDEEIRQRVLSIVADKTGYPADMLDMDLDLEADLGIDTVKQAEIFAAMREAYDIPRDPDLQLKDFPTLKHTLAFVKDRLPEDAGAVAETTTTAPPVAPKLPAIAGDMDAANQVPRRVPTAYWRPSLDLCKPTGIELDDGARVVVMPDNGGVARALVERLEKRGVESLVIEGAPSAAELEATLDDWLSKGGIDGVYWLSAMDGHDALNEMDFASWSESLRLRVKLLSTTMRKLYEHYSDAGKFLIAGTRLGGKHGYDSDGAINPMGGAVSGFVKAFKREQGNALCKIVDFEVSRKTAALADRLIAETLKDPGVVEVGIQQDQRWTIGLAEIPADSSRTGIDLNDETVFVVTGAAGSIVSAIVNDLAAASRGTFHLLDLTPEPDRNDPDIARFTTDKDGLKRDIFERIKATGKRATPAMVEKELARLERAEAALNAIRAVEESGGTAHYHAVDLSDVAAVEQTVHNIIDTSAKIDVLVHAAGVEISHFLPAKPASEFDLVFDVKCNGWYGLMHAIGDMPLQAAVVFSSVAGRFGNGGQTDYSAANDLLCKSISGFRSTRPDTLGVAIDWTAWGGIGMATRGSIPVMMEAAGIDMLTPEAGIPVVRRELIHGAGTTEVVIAKRLGILTAEWDETGGLDLDALPARGAGPMMGRIVGMGVWNGLTVETELDPAAQPFLHDHEIDGVPVLPGVMGLEAFAELSNVLLPEWQVEAIENIEFLAPFKFYRSEPRQLRLTAQFRDDGDGMYADCKLVGIRKIRTQDEPVMTEHFNASVCLSRDEPESVSGEKPTPINGPAIDSNDVYGVYFHGPAYRVLDSAWGDGPGTVIGRMAAELPENHSPANLPTQIAPRHIELCFQTAGMYELGEAGRLGLPSRIRRVSKLREPSKQTLYSIVRHTDGGEGYDADVVDQEGTVYIRLQDYRTAELPGGADADRIAPIRAALNRS